MLSLYFGIPYSDLQDALTESESLAYLDFYQRYKGLMRPDLQSAQIAFVAASMLAKQKPKFEDFVISDRDPTNTVEELKSRLSRFDIRNKETPE
jgi:hypothetical protein